MVVSNPLRSKNHAIYPALEKDGLIRVALPMRSDPCSRLSLASGWELSRLIRG
jgi:hypothetical protein